MSRPEPLSRRELLSGGRRAAGEDGHWVRVHRRAMACRFEVTLPDEDARHVEAARAALDEADRVEGVLTVFREGSDPLIGLFGMTRSQDLPAGFRDCTFEEPPLTIRCSDGSVHPEYQALKLSIGFPP